MEESLKDPQKMAQMMAMMKASQPPMPQPQAPAPMPEPKLTPYDQQYIASKNAVENNFFTSGREYQAVRWKIENDLLEKYNRSLKLPDYNQISLAHMI